MCRCAPQVRSATVAQTAGARARCSRHGHVAWRSRAQVAWSSDSRLFVSASKDSTLKARSCHARQLLALPSGACCPRLLRLILQPAHAARTPPPRQVWDLRTRKLVVDLPGHADEVFCVDWSPDGASVASGGKDKVLKLWRH